MIEIEGIIVLHQIIWLIAILKMRHLILSLALFTNDRVCFLIVNVKEFCQTWLPWLIVGRNKNNIIQNDWKCILHCTISECSRYDSRRFYVKIFTCIEKGSIESKIALRFGLDLRHNQLVRRLQAKWPSRSVFKLKSRC